MVVSISAAALAVLALAPQALGRITNITFPSTVPVGGQVSALITNRGYISNENDFGIVFGIQRDQQYACGTCVGELVYYFNNANETQSGNYLESVIPLTGREPYPVNFTLPTSYEAGTYTFVAAVPHLVGASGGTSITYFNGTVTVTGNSTA